MQPADAPTGSADQALNRSSTSPVSVAIVAAVACIPLVIAAGFLVDRPKAGPGAADVPADVSVLALRRGLDGLPVERSPAPARAGF